MTFTHHGSANLRMANFPYKLQTSSQNLQLSFKQCQNPYALTYDFVVQYSRSQCRRGASMLLNFAFCCVMVNVPQLFGIVK